MPIKEATKNTDVAFQKAKLLKKKYNEIAAKNMVVFRLNSQEASLLESMMNKEGFENISGFIKYKLFGFEPERRYKYLLKNGKKEDKVIIVKNLISEMCDVIGYLNYRFTFELDEIKKKSATLDEKTARRIFSKMKEWKDTISKRTDRLFCDLNYIFKHLEMPVEVKRDEDIRHVPDEIIDKAASKWNDSSSPEALEAGRRALERWDKRVAEYERERENE